MNYFELFDIPVSFQIDQEVLKKKYNELSGKTNTDVTDDEKEEQAGILSKASQLGKAYKTLQSEDETIRYVLKLKNLLGDEDGYKPDPQFLLEVMDINEELMELEMDENQEQLINVEQKATRVLLKIYEDVTPVINAYQEDTASEEELLQVKDFYYQKKYVEGILDRIKGIRNIAPSS